MLVFHGFSESILLLLPKGVVRMGGQQPARLWFFFPKLRGGDDRWNVAQASSSSNSTRFSRQRQKPMYKGR